MESRPSYGGDRRVRFEKLETLLRVALDMRGTAEGISLDDIQRTYSVSRRTAERMRDAIERVFPQMEQANPGEVPKRWRIRAGVLSGMVAFSAEELAALASAAQLARRDNLDQISNHLETLTSKLKSLIPAPAARRINPDLEALMEAESIALRAGPRQTIPSDLLAGLRHAIIACRQVRLHYRGRGTGRVSRQLVSPYGFLYANRHYLVAYSLSDRARDYRLFSLTNIEKVELTETPFERQRNFSLQKFAERSFGVFQEQPFDVAWRFSPKAAPDARQFLFHPTQAMEDQPDGSLIVRFRAGGALEMSWHLFTWGSEVEVLEPPELRKRLERGDRRERIKSGRNPEGVKSS